MRAAFFIIIVPAGVFTVVLSSLQLIIALVPLILAGPASPVVRGYSDLITHAVHYIFGRLDFGWMQVTELEGHVMVLAAAVLAIIAREALGNRASGIGRHTGYQTIALLFTSCFICIVVLPLIVLPGWWGTGMVAANLAVLAAATFRIADR